MIAEKGDYFAAVVVFTRNCSFNFSTFSNFEMRLPFLDPYMPGYTGIIDMLTSFPDHPLKDCEIDCTISITPTFLFSDKPEGYPVPPYRHALFFHFVPDYPSVWRTCCKAC